MQNTEKYIVANCERWYYNNDDWQNNSGWENFKPADDWQNLEDAKNKTIDNAD